MFAYSMSIERFCDFMAATREAPRSRTDLGSLTITHGTIDKLGPVVLVQGVGERDCMIISSGPILESGLTQVFGEATTRPARVA
jgi:hypothetical protein